jgi:hypothetical protein
LAPLRPFNNLQAHLNSHQGHDDPRFELNGWSGPVWA